MTEVEQKKVQMRMCEVDASKVNIELHPDISDYLDHYFTSNRLPNFLNKSHDARQQYLNANPIRSVKEYGVDTYWAYGGLLSYLIFLLYGQNTDQKLKVLIFVQDVSQIKNVQATVAANLIEARSLGNPQLIKQYKCPKNSSLSKLLLDNWPAATSGDDCSSWHQDLTDAGFIRSVDKSKESSLNILDELMEKRDYD